MTSIGWYIHLPFCTTKCGYCDFYSLPTIPALVDDLVWAVSEELTRRDPGRPVETIFIGGGTPTVLPAAALETILRTVSQHAGAATDGRLPFRIEFTVEANPSSTDELKLEVLRRFGVNRVSFGAQSFNPDELAVLERIHEPGHIFESIRAARAAGFDNINLDLMYAIPGQTVARWRDTLRRAIDIGTEHLSCYALMYETGTSLTRLRHDGRILPCDEDAEAEMFELTIDELTAAGFEHYEISNFAKPGRRCRANIIYWENREYLGIGPSAVSYLDGERRKNVADVRKYIQFMKAGSSEFVVETECLDPMGRASETAVQMLRMTDGIDFARFESQTGFHAAALFAEQMKRYTDQGLARLLDCSFALTRNGLRVANQILPDFLAGEQREVQTATSEASNM